MDCGALNCYYNSRSVDKHGFGECTSNPTLGTSAKCMDHDVYDDEQLMEYFGVTRVPITKRIVEGREGSVDDWTDDQNRTYDRVVEHFSVIKSN